MLLSLDDSRSKGAFMCDTALDCSESFLLAGQVPLLFPLKRWIPRKCNLGNFFEFPDSGLVCMSNVTKKRPASIPTKLILKALKHLSVHPQYRIPITRVYKL
eukprot:GFYU01032434.1.p3 GENE.GFYU01032434.1~~GFYU01032434.1.p3  ORF type:complete len:102 (-),score=0.35 GFYU01032434.1:468-773(-)